MLVSICIGLLLILNLKDDDYSGVSRTGQSNQ
jgi:hypothetical protein